MAQPGPWAVKRIDEMQRAFGGMLVRVRAELDGRAFGLQVADLPPDSGELAPEHDHTYDGQEEVYLLLDGSGEVVLDGTVVPLDREMFVRIGPGVRRRLRSGPHGARVLMIGAMPGRPYTPPPMTELGGPETLAANAEGSLITQPPPEEGLPDMSTAAAAPYHLAAGEGRPMSWFTAQFQLKASDAQIGLMELDATPGVEPPMHTHRNEDEWYYILDGTVTFHVGEQIYRGETGSTVFLPRGIPHTFTIESETARMLLLNAPGGFERMFELAPSTPDEAIAALARYDVEVVGPHPRELPTTAR